MENRCKEDMLRRIEALRDPGVTQDLGNGMSRRVDFHVGYDHRAFPDDCGGGGHGQHGMEMAFYLIGPDGVVQWKIAMPSWTPRPVSITGNLEHVAMRGIDDIYAVDLGYHWPTPRYENQSAMECEMVPGGTCYYDGSGLNAGPILQKFLYFGPHAVWAELARYYQSLVNDEEGGFGELLNAFIEQMGEGDA